jgi:membrane fusion protein, heavy metal efflux system
MSKRSRRAGKGAARAVPAYLSAGTLRFARPAICAIIAACAVLLANPISAESVATIETKAPKSPDSVRVTNDQLHQLVVVPVVTDQFRIQKPAIGQIAFNEDASTVVLTPFSGRVTRLIARIGDNVKRGDPLFEIDSPEVVQAQTDLIAALHGLEKAKSQLSLASRTLDRQSGLMKDKATSMREVDQARNDHAAAESDLATAQGTLTAARNRLCVIVGRDREEVERLERERSINPLITINAPIDGTVISRKVGPGQYVRSDAADPLYGIADLTTMWLKANVPENDIASVQVGQEIEVRVTALPDRVYKARISAIGAASDSATRRVVVRSELPNPDRRLKSEMFASFKITVGSGDSLPVVPVEAVIRDGEQAIVWVAREPMLFQRRKVKVGLERDGRVQVLEGIDAGERVVGRGAVFVDNESRS